MKSNKKLILGLLLVALLLVVGVTYAFFTYENGTRSEIVTGQIYLNYTEENKITLTNAWPETKTTAMKRTDNVFNFTIEGQNTSREDIFYAVKINYADDIAGKTRISAEHIRIYLECDGDILIDGVTYNDWNDKKIEIATIPAGTTNRITKKYSLRMWIDENVTISDTSNSADYTTSEWNNNYANMIINVSGNFDYQDTDYITYDANGGDYTPVKTSVSDGKITLQKPVMENKNFLGWSSNPDATEIEYYSGDAYTGDGKVLYAVYGDTRNVMTDLNVVKETSVNEVYFINETQENIDARYNAATDKWDLTLDNQGSVKGWIETQIIEGDGWSEETVVLYIASEGTTYFSTGYELFTDIDTERIFFTNVDTSMVTTMYGMFSRMDNTGPEIELDLSGFNTSNVTDMSYMFMRDSYDRYFSSINLSNFDTSNVTNMSHMFEYQGYLTSLDVSNFDTSKVTDMSSMFSGCSSVTNLDVSNFDTSNVIDMSYMFSAGLTSLDLSKFDTSNVTNMQGMFSFLRDVTNLDISNFDTSNVTDMSYMFYECESLTNIDLSGFNTSNVTDMSHMFSKCTSLTSLNLSNWDTKNVTSMQRMFSECPSLISLDLSNFDVNQVTDMQEMFRFCSNLTTIYTNLDWNGFVVTYSWGMFGSCPNLVGAVPYDETKTDITMANPDTGYFTRKEA